MKKRGFTLVELLVVIAIIAMLLAILMPALGKVRQLAYRMMCGTNLKGLGNAMMVYSNDYDESYPIAGGSATLWDPLGSTWAGIWDNKDATTTDRNVNATVSASLYLLVKYADVSPKQFVCQASDEKQFELDTATASKQNYSSIAKDLVDCWDFGKVISSGANGPWDYVSYCYQLPYKVVAGGSVYAPSVSSSAGLTLMADKNPWFDKNLTDPALYAWDTAKKEINKQATTFIKAQSQDHQTEGQNVLYNDAHVSFEKTANVAVQQDNIYTYWGSGETETTATEQDKQVGAQPLKNSQLASANDTLLVNDNGQ